MFGILFKGKRNDKVFSFVVRIKELSKIKGFNDNELNDLFLDSSYNFELNQVAHPNLLNYKNEIYELGEFNKKLFDYVFMKYN